MSDIQSTAGPAVDEQTRSRPSHPAPRHARHDADVDPLTILAHDLRNYLTPVSAHLATLYKRGQQEQRDPDMHAASRGRQALDYALLLIADMLDATRLEHGLFDLHLAPLDLSLLAQQTAEVFETSRSPIVLCMPETVIVPADRERLRQVLHNLFANAVAHSPCGMAVSVELCTEQRDHAKWAVLTIRNGGPAIPAHLLPHIFGRFAAGPNSQGLGLGLYLAHGIVEAHGGTLTAHSNDGAGTCFVLRLPLGNVAGAMP